METFLVVDIESNGRSSHTDSPIAFAYARFNKDFSKVLETGLFYLYKKDMPLNKFAEAVHGLSRAFLSNYEEEYEQNVARLYELMNGSNVVGHNSDVFDVPMITNFLIREGYPQIQNPRHLDTMRIFPKAKLINLTHSLGADDEDLVELHDAWFEEKSLQSWHTASFDVTATAYCCIMAVEQGLIKV